MSANEIKQDEIIRMAREAGGFLGNLPKGDAWMFFEDAYLERFAGLVAAHEREQLENSQESKSLKEIVERMEAAIRADEREACAKLVDNLYHETYIRNIRECAAAIRARGEK